MADIIKTVGDGHGAPDYADIALWNTGEGGVDPGVGFTSIADCSGNIGVSDTINGAFIRSYSVEGNTTYDGTNESSLAMVDRLTVSTTGNISDIKITSTNAFLTAFSISADNCNINRCRISHPTASGVPTVNITAAIAATTFSQCVITGGNDTIRAGFAQGAAFNKCVVLDSTDKGFEGSGGAGILTATDVYSGNATSDDYDSAQMTLSFAASSDATGSAGLQNITVANALVNVGIDDYRSKAGGPLDGTGSIDYIGAFLEVSGGITVATTETLQSLSDTVITNIDYNVSITTTENLSAYSDSVSVTVTPDINITASITETLNPYSDAASVNITATGSVSCLVTEQLTSYADSAIANISANVGVDITETLNSFLDSSNVTIAKDVTLAITESLGAYSDFITVKLPTVWVDKTPSSTGWAEQTVTTTIWIDKG